MPSVRGAVTLVTCDLQPQLHASDLVLAKELASLGAGVRVASWSDDSVDWSQTLLTVLRSTWDAHLRPNDFKSWLRRIATQTRLCNEASALLWNFDKAYLLELGAKGVPIIPSRYIEKDFVPLLRAADIPWEIVVVKPSVGGGSHGVLKFNARTELEALNAHLSMLLRTSRALIQRFEPEVESKAERSLVFIGGEYTHAVRRVPFNRGSTPDTGEFDHDASREEIAFARRTLEAAGAQRMAFARVDLIPAVDGLLLMELEIIDPALFFTRKPSAATKLARVLLGKAYN